MTLPISPVFTLQRIRQTSKATFGEMRDSSGERLCYTIERPWLGNQHGVSCIPPGSYHVRLRWSPKHERNVYGLLDVPGRSDIEIHSANLPSELEGCIALGTEFGEVSTAKHGDGYGVRHSKDAVTAFESTVGVTDWTLVIRDVTDQ